MPFMGLPATGVPFSDCSAGGNRAHGYVGTAVSIVNCVAAVNHGVGFSIGRSQVAHSLASNKGTYGFCGVYNLVSLCRSNGNADGEFVLWGSGTGNFCGNPF